MKEVTVNNVKVSLSDDTNIRLTRGNMVMGGKDNYTLPIDLNTDDTNNAKAIQHLHKLSTVGDRGATSPIKLSIGRIPIVVGESIIDEFRERTTSIMFKGNSQGFWERTSEVLLSDLDWPEISPFHADTRTLTGVKEELTSTTSAAKDYVAFEMNSVQDLQDDDGLQQGGVFNLWSLFDGDTNTAGFVNVSGSGPGDMRYANNVFIRLHVVFQKIFENFGYKVAQNFFSSGGNESIVVINRTNLWSLEDGAVNYAHFLPNKTVSSFLQDFVESGVVFDIDSVSLKVNITTTNAKMGIKPSKQKNIVQGSRIITPERNNGYIVSMNNVGAYDEHAFIRSEKYPYYDDLPTAWVKQKSDLPSASIFSSGFFLIVLSLGCYYQIEEDSNGNKLWQKAMGRTLSKAEGDQDISISSPLSVAINSTMYPVNYNGDDEYRPQMPTVDLSPDEELTDTILTVYRGVLLCPYDEDTVMTPNNRPFANYWPYDGFGNVLTGVELGIPFIFDLSDKKIEFMQNCNQVKYQFNGSLSDMVRPYFDPLLLDGQFSMLKTRQAKLPNENREIIITDTVYAEQNTGE